MKNSINANDIEALGVSPAKSYGHVAGTPARFFGAGIIKIPKLDGEETPFKVYIRRTAAGVYEFKARKGFVDGKEATGAVGNEWNRITPQTQSVILECKIDTSMNITEANIKADRIKETNFRVELSGKNQLYARIIIAQFDVDSGQITLIQNIKTNLYTSILCYEGVPARYIHPEAQ